MEINSIKGAGKDSLRVNGYIQAQQNNEKFSTAYFNSVKFIRSRISKLAILPGN